MRGTDATHVAAPLLFDQPIGIHLDDRSIGQGLSRGTEEAMGPRTGRGSARKIPEKDAPGFAAGRCAQRVDGREPRRGAAAGLRE